MSDRLSFLRSTELLSTVPAPLVAIVMLTGVVWLTGLAEITLEGAANYRWAAMLGLELPVHPIVGIASKILWGFLLFTVFIVGEEIGWSGFLVPKLLNGTLGHSSRGVRGDNQDLSVIGMEDVGPLLRRDHLGVLDEASNMREDSFTESEGWSLKVPRRTFRQLARVQRQTYEITSLVRPRGIGQIGRQHDQVVTLGGTGMKRIV